MEYNDRLKNEIEFYAGCEDFNELPPIFHYWANKHLRPTFERMGFSSPDDFFLTSVHEQVSERGRLSLASIGSGNCELEVKIASSLLERGAKFSVECVDINQSCLDRGAAAAEKAGVLDSMKFSNQDFNQWKPAQSYDIVIANQSLHHVLELENLFLAVKRSLRPGGRLLISDMIGRNGHQRWPEAMELMRPLWEELPPSYRYNQQLKRQEDEYMDFDCSSEHFEGIRAQDILPLLRQYFCFELFAPYGNIIFPFIDRAFGHNFDATSKSDLEFIDRVQSIDHQAILDGRITPTSMLAICRPSGCGETRLVHPILTPEHCTRYVEGHGHVHRRGLRWVKSKLSRLLGS